MEEILAQRAYANAVAAGRAGENHCEGFNAGVLGCLKGRLDSVMPLDCQYLEGTKDHAEFQAGVVEGRELSPITGAPFGMDDAEWNQD